MDSELIPDGHQPVPQTVHSHHFWTSQSSNSSFSSFSKYFLHTSFIPSCSTTTLPTPSLIQPIPTTSLVFSTICLTTLNTLPFPSASSSVPTSFFLSASCALLTTFLVSLLAAWYAASSLLVLVFRHSL